MGFDMGIGEAAASVIGSTGYTLPAVTYAADGSLAASSAVSAGWGASGILGAISPGMTYDVASAGGMHDISMGLQGLSAVGNAIGAQYQGEAARKAALANEGIQNYNALMAQRNAQMQAAQGEANLNIQNMKTRATAGAIAAQQGANGLDVNSGSNVDVKSSAAALGELNALTLKSNTQKNVYASESQANSFQQQADLYGQKADDAVSAANISSAMSLLGGAASVAGNAGMWQLQTKKLVQ
jgi:hypothetical protein